MSQLPGGTLPDERQIHGAGEGVFPGVGQQIIRDVREDVAVKLEIRVREVDRRTDPVVDAVGPGEGFDDVDPRP